MGYLSPMYKILKAFNNLPQKTATIRSNVSPFEFRGENLKPSIWIIFSSDRQSIEKSGTTDSPNPRYSLSPSFLVLPEYVSESQAKADSYRMFISNHGER